MAPASSASSATTAKPGGPAPSRSLRLFAALVEAEALRSASRAPGPADSDLVRAFRGGATPKAALLDFLERIHRAGRLEGTSFVLAGVYLARFCNSKTAIEAGLKLEPATAHRLAAVAVFVGAKFGGHPHKRWTPVFEVCSGRAIRADEMAALERRFLRAIDYRLYVRSEEYDSFVRILVAGPQTLAAGSCSGGKRKAAGEVAERRRVRPCLPTPPVIAAI